MPQNTLIVSNWKMNLDLVSAKSLIYKLKRINLDANPYVKNIVCPQFLLIPYVSSIIGSSKILLGAQDCHYEENGSFTGDSSISLIKKFGCKYVILGHSERRKNYFEENIIVKKKILLAKKNKITPIVCVGEPAESRKNNSHFEYVLDQLNLCIPENISEIIIAYEPIWSIGTGKIPTNLNILEMRDFCLKFLEKKKKIKEVSFLYGGSVNSQNLLEIIKKSFVDGALIGGASIDYKEIIKILKMNFN
jgi:triosephosphate isomerase